MEPLLNIVEPTALLLTWQPEDEAAKSRTRRVVGMVRPEESGNVSFRYLTDEPDFADARASGFVDYPAFKFSLAQTQFDRGVLDVFLKRLPPRNRSDFDRFLAIHRLPHPFPGSDLALLGYTGAKLPSDGFMLVPLFPDDSKPCDFIAEVAGLRHSFNGDVSELKVGDAVTFEQSVGNPVDPDAVKVLWRGLHLGWVNRAMRETFTRWMLTRQLTGTIERVNGKPSRPLVYVRVLVR